jgi:hypothetical protein
VISLPAALAQVADVNRAGAKTGDVRAGPDEASGRELGEDRVLVRKVRVAPYGRTGIYGEHLKN